MRQESFTRIPAEIVDYAKREHPQIPMSEFFDRALRRVGKSSPSEQKSLIAMGKPFANDLESWVRCPYSIESSVWDRFTEVVEKRITNPAALAAIVAGALMAEVGMS